MAQYKKNFDREEEDRWKKETCSHFNHISYYGMSIKLWQWCFHHSDLK